eukprot:GHVT01088836.1.p1 GENE.GHVT01088836.1~~GHVT01088836.1.p1  ORF type:complete len:136 (+),score=9.24 GHVT01088836.1:211-618(+)
MAAPLPSEKIPRLLPMTADVVAYRLGLPHDDDPPLEKLELYRFFMSPYAPERDRECGTSGGSKFKEGDKLKFWKQVHLELSIFDVFTPLVLKDLVWHFDTSRDGRSFYDRKSRLSVHLGQPFLCHVCANLMPTVH